MATPFPIFKTERLHLREIKLSDAHRIHYLRSDEEITKFIKRSELQTFDTTVAHIKKIRNQLRRNQSIAWGISLHTSTELIGSICLWNFSEDKKTAEVGYDLDTKFQNKGFMSEALKAILNYGFTQKGFETIVAYTDYRNIPSKNLLKRFGFIPSNTLKDTDNQNNVVFYLNR
ncbi:GNAT family N-acetyltransferase [Aequorivita sediminis]|uniref:GNAT family N-acetyltransferase n=1 Tax=Aequorivita sediminis TaxID=3073653 RepID=UPI0028B11C55|nr:GNAT family N-acetyltransferase [Aequorivita sp. F6058]